MERTFVLTSETGLHARPATNFVKFMQSLPGEVLLIHKNFTADAKSIMAIMSLGLAKGESFKIYVRDEDDSYLDQIESYMRLNHLID
ncbi:MAG TPA: HPr family phosphocarrier protein [Acholeplasmataceae bacterium]|nr:HPr family phosphocarrier protein [Acholeplasmataceae bacterium]